MKSELRCKHCRFLGETKIQGYTCRINPPQLAKVESDSGWPPVNINEDWCSKLEQADGAPVRQPQNLHSFLKSYPPLADA